MYWSGTHACERIRLHVWYWWGGSLTPVPDTQRIHVTLHGLSWHAAYCAYYYLMYKLLLHLPVRARFLPVGLCKNVCVCVFMCVSASLVAVVAVHMRNKYTLSLLMAAVLLHTLSVVPLACSGKRCSLQ